MIKRIISCIVSTVIVLGATIAYDRTPACRIAVMEQVPTQLASVLPRAASYELELRTEEGNRSYTVNCHDKDGSTFRSYTMQTVEVRRSRSTSPTRTTPTTKTATVRMLSPPTRSTTLLRNTAAAMTTKTAFFARKTTRTANFRSPPRRFTPRLTTVSPLPSTRFTTQTATS